MLYKILFILLLINFVIVYCNEENKHNKHRESYESNRLKLVVIVHRHGDRAPYASYPTDPYNEDDWFMGYQQLTNEGKDRMFRLGKYLRKRYRNYLSYSPREVQIRSSAIDRCLASVGALLAGLYPPVGEWVWNRDLGRQWQPFPIQTLPPNLDNMLALGAPCPAATQEQTNILTSEAVNQYVESNRVCIKCISSNDFTAAMGVYDTLSIEKQNNFKLPNWVTNSVYKGLSGICDHWFYFMSSTKLIQRLTVGVLLNDIIQRIEDRINPNINSTTKLYLYSAHDTNIAFLLSALNVFNMKRSPFGATIIFELYESNSDYIFKTFYLNETYTERPFSLQLPQCTDSHNNCYFEQFVSSLNDVIPVDWQQECNDMKYQ